MPAEFWFSEQYNMTILMIRSSPSDGMRGFVDELVSFIMTIDFKHIALLTATMSSVSCDRDSNDDIPEIYAYCNNYIELRSDYYEEKGMRKFGHWI